MHPEKHSLDRGICSLPKFSAGGHHCGQLGFPSHDLVSSLPVLFGMLYWYDLEFPWLFLPALPLLILVQAILTTGLSFIVATANVFYRDVSQITGMIVSLLFS